MTTKRKTQLKRAALSWLCVAALVSGSVPAGLPGIIPTVTAAAEDTQTIVSTINLGNLVEYVTNPHNCPAGITASYGKNNNGDTYNSIIELTINESGTYKLTGSNLINDTYFDVKIIAAKGIGNVNIVCENAFIRNDEGSYEYLCTYNADSDKYCYDRYSGGDLVTAADFVVPFKAEKDAAITLSGTLAVDTFSIYNAWNREWNSYGYNYIVPVSEGDGNVNTDAFSVVKYTDNNGGVIDKGYYLSAGENNAYSADLDKISITSCKQNNEQFLGDIEKKSLSEMYVCFNTDGSRFNTASITGDVTVECSETHTDIDEDYTCDNCGDYFIIDLNKLGDYADGNTALPVNITAESSDNSITLTITHSGKYKLTGSNTTDVKIYAPSGVTADIVCDNAYIKNTNGSYSIENEYDEYAPILSLEASGYICPFGTYDSGKINLSGKLVVDTYSVFNITWDEYRIGDFIAEVAKESYSVTGDFTPIDSYTNGKKDQAFYLNGAVYDASDYAGDHLCISVRGNDVGDYTFTAGTDNISFISYNDDHRFDNDSDVCKDCGNTFERYNVTFNDGSETPATERVINGRTVSAPESDPTAPVGMKFTGWYSNAECTSKYDFANPVTGNITLYAGWEALPVKSVAVKTAPDTTSYIEGQKFDPDGLVIAVTYENGTLEVAYTDETKGDFTFTPALTKELALSDEKVTITYGGKSADQDITVAKKQVSSIAVKTPQTKTSYIEGQKFDPAGLVITATYDNGKSEDITYSDSTKDGFTFAPAELSLGDTKVTITYGGKSADQEITVAKKQLSSIAVKTPQTKTTYIEGEKYDPAGLVITLTYNNGKTEDVAYSDSTKDGFTFSPEVLTLNSAKVTITYGGKSVEQAVTVTNKSLASIAVKTAPTKTSYIEGEVFDPTGLVITLTYDNGKTEDVAYSDSTKDGFTFSPEVLTLNSAKVTITYGGKSVEQAVTVTNKSLASIAVKTAPTKTSYIEGEVFDPTGLVITLTYDNGKTEDVAYSDSTKDGFTFTFETLLATGDEIVTITYGGKRANLTVTFTNKSLNSIVVKTAPKKTSYIAGEKFNPTGLAITLTYNNGKTEDVAYSDSTKGGFTFAPEAFAVGDKNVTITYAGKTVEQSIKVSSKSSGGSSGGSSGSSSGGGSSRPTTPTPTNPSIGGSSKSWSDVAADLGKLTSDSETTITLNGSTTVPVDVIKSIADTGSNVKLVINSAYSWIVDGADITSPAAADLTFIKTASTKSSGLRGTEGTQFKINDTGVPTSLEIAFKTSHAGKFANLYKSVDGKLTFVTCAKLGEDGKVILPDVAEKGDYVAMLCEFSDLNGDISNDGVLNALDTSAVLKDIVGMEPGKNPLVADFNGDGRINAMDASAILKRIVGLA